MSGPLVCQVNTLKPLWSKCVATVKLSQHFATGIFEKQNSTKAGVHAELSN